MTKTNVLRDLHEIFTDSENNLVFEKNVDIPRTSQPPIRCNVYRPLDDSNKRYPVLVTYGPYGKDIPYSSFHPASFSEVNPEHKSKYSVWETPDPVFWTARGYVIVRADERGLGQSPGLLDTMSRGTSECFFDVVEWAADQSWSTGKVGLLGISYYAGSQWRVAARRPKGLAAIVPWEGMSDYYRDRCRHGGILSDKFIEFWWNRQVITNQYGRAGRAASNWGEDTLEGDLLESVLKLNRQDQTEDNVANEFRDQEYYATKDFNLSDIEVPLLSVANWGGILLHLRGNIEGFVQARSKFKYLRCIVGRHDLPFYYRDEVEIQKSFLDAFLKGEDEMGWSKEGAIPKVSLVLRKGDVGFNNPQFEATYKRREETSWPIERTQYTQYFLSPDGALELESKAASSVQTYPALGNIEDPKYLQFRTAPFTQEIEFTGYITAHLNVSMTPQVTDDQAKDIDLFVTLRYISPEGKEVHYTGTAGDPIPLAKGWLRVSHRKVDDQHPLHRSYLPYRTYFSSDVQEVKPGEIYSVDVEIWPTNIVVEKGGQLVFEVSSGDTQGCGIFQHRNKRDRSESKLAGTNHLHFGEGHQNYITLPIVPAKSNSG